MTQTATLLLLFSGLLTSREQKALAHFADQRGLTVVAPTPTPASPYPPYRPDFVLELEGRLAEARTLASSLDEERALVVLDAIERDLLRSPELPQAAFLLAERHRIAASLLREQPGGAARVEELVGRARALEGDRATAFGAPADPLVSTPPGRLLRIVDLGARDRLELDGEPGGAERRTVPGLHHARVLRAGEVVWAGFVDVPASPGDRWEHRLGVRPLVPCSAEDLLDIDARGSSPRAPSGVACGRWLAVRRVYGKLEAAECARSSCGAFQPVADVSETRPLVPDWAKPVIAGVGTAGVVLGLLWATGAFSPEPPPGRTTFVYRGPP